MVSNGMNQKLAIIILNYRSWQDTLLEIDICNRVLDVANEDVIVIDNCSPNESAERLKERADEIGFVFIESKENKGYGAGNNIGMKYALNHGYTYAFILNNDIIIKDSNLISKLLSVFNEDRRIAVVNPDIFAPNGHMFNRDALKPSFYDYTIGLIDYRKKGRAIKNVNGYGYIYRPQGCCMLVDLSKMEDVGFFDEKIFLYCEEPILAERLLRKNYLCACNTTAAVIHNHSKTVKSVFNRKKIISLQNKSFAYYLREYRKFSLAQTKICLMFNTIKFLILE